MKLHPFIPDSSSGAGNCICGAAERHMLHPHKYLKAHDSLWCTCGFPKHSAMHDEVEGEKVA